MKIECLKEIITLEKLGNFLEAADSLYMSQSSLSRHVQRAENELGISLFDRTTRKLTVSDEGMIWMPYMKEIVSVYDEFMKNLGLQVHENPVELVIGHSLQALAPYKITALLGKFEQECADIRIVSFETIREENGFENNFDFAFVREIKGKEAPGFHRLCIDEDMLVAILPKDHPLAGAEQVTLEQLKYEEFVLTEKKRFLSNLCLSEFEKAGFDPNVVYSGIHGRNLIDMLIEEKCCSLLLKKAAQYLYGDFVAVVDLVPRIPIQINLIWPKRPLNDPALRFVQFAENFFGRKREE
ncbi:MAG: LysR family transcriptional regulator [Eubacteriales bacterium]|nr:LysR family transcriptional regulator [Eubacteriales bacterium]